MNYEREDRPDVVEIGRGYSESHDVDTFSVDYGGTEYVFKQNYWGDHWAISQSIGVSRDMSDSELLEHLMVISRAASLLDAAGFEAQRLDDETVLWTRDEDVPLWPEALE